jgi:hypothetical protein
MNLSSSGAQTYANRGEADPKGSAVVEHDRTTTPLEAARRGDDPITSLDGRQFLQVEGVIEPGDQRGRLLGFPTANLTVPDGEIGEGVWAGTVQIDPNLDGPTYLAAVSVGRRPTYYAEGKRLLEANLLGYSGDLYGRRVLVTLHLYLRPQRRFPGTAELTIQLQTDVACVRAWGMGAGFGSPTDVTAIDRPLSNFRRGAMPHKRSKRRAVDVEHIKRGRAVRRLAVLQRAVAELASTGEPTHEDMARLTGIPVGYLLWAYPTSDSLLAVASEDSS